MHYEKNIFITSQFRGGNHIMKPLTLFIALFISATCCYSQPGTLDKSFGNEGIVIAGNPYGQNRPNVIAVLPDDKIIVSSTFLGTTFNGKMLARYLPDGSPDLSFGNDGTTYLESKLFTGLAIQQGWENCFSRFVL